MPEVYKLTDEEAEFLIECLDAWYYNRKDPIAEELQKYMNLRQYLMEGERG
ncbi:MAG: hypothetical protein KAT75_04330 [Dehalococcoidia bacterium]|nr:hypothetical protein [Dehalococcoidia bacterium]